MKYFSKTLNYSGLKAELVESSDIPGCWILYIDGYMNSALNPDKPAEIIFDYGKKVREFIDHLFEAGKPLEVLHLGGAALGFPRYIGATRPGSSQVVVEIEDDLIDFVIEILPCEKNLNLEIIYGDAREVIEKTLTTGTKKFDLIISEIFLGATTPANVSSEEFYLLTKSLLKDDGVLVTNSIDNGDFFYTKSQIKTLEKAFTTNTLFVWDDVKEVANYRNSLIVSSNRDIAHGFTVELENTIRRGKFISDQDLKDWSEGGITIKDFNSYEWPPKGKKNAAN